MVDILRTINSCQWLLKEYYSNTIINQIFRIINENGTLHLKSTLLGIYKGVKRGIPPCNAQARERERERERIKEICKERDRKKERAEMSIALLLSSPVMTHMPASITSPHRGSSSSRLLQVSCVTKNHARYNLFAL